MDKFVEIDDVCLYNSRKVLDAFQMNKEILPPYLAISDWARFYFF